MTPALENNDNIEEISTRINTLSRYSKLMAQRYSISDNPDDIRTLKEIKKALRKRAFSVLTNQERKV